jgi:predicted nuclease of predicted toxin-antitoxin system
VKLVVDMNLSTDWVAPLRQVGIDTVHWSELGPPDASDDAIMVWSRENHAIVLTRDLDFGAALMLHALPSPSVVQLRIKKIRPEQDIALVRRALSLHGTHLERGAIVTIEEHRIRARVLDSSDNP